MKCHPEPVEGIEGWSARGWAFRLEDSPSGHSLQVLAEAAPGFPLLSLTRNTGSDPSGGVSEWGVLFYRLRPLRGRTRIAATVFGSYLEGGVAHHGIVRIHDPEGV